MSIITPANKNIPNQARIAWKYGDEQLFQHRIGADIMLDRNNDVDGVLNGIQNESTLYGIAYRSDCPDIDVYMAGKNIKGQSKQPRWVRSTLQFTLKNSGGIDSNDVSIEVAEPSQLGNNDDIQVGDELIAEAGAPDGEIMRVTAVSKTSPNWTLTVTRGEHGTTAAAQGEDSTLTYIYSSWDHKRITLTGDTSDLGTADTFSLDEEEGYILLQWIHSLTAAQLQQLKTWRVYYDTSSGVSTSDSYVDVGLTSPYGFVPISGGSVDTETTYYFKICSVTHSGTESSLSSEISGKAWSAANKAIDTGVFTPLSGTTLSWTNGALYWNGSQYSSYNSGSKLSGLAANTTYWIYFVRTVGTVLFTTDVATASTKTNICIGTVETTSDADEFCTITQFFALGGTSLSLTNLYAYYVSGAFSSFGTMTAGEINCTGGFLFRTDDAGEWRLQIDDTGLFVEDNSANQGILLDSTSFVLKFYGSTVAWTGGSIDFGTESEIVTSNYYGITTFRPQSSGDGKFYLGHPTGSIGTDYWDTIVLAADNILQGFVYDVLAKRTGFYFEDNRFDCYIDDAVFIDAELGSVYIGAGDTEPIGYLALSNVRGKLTFLDTGRDTSYVDVMEEQIELAIQDVPVLDITKDGASDGCTLFAPASATVAFNNGVAFELDEAGGNLIIRIKKAAGGAEAVTLAFD